MVRISKKVIAARRSQAANRMCKLVEERDFKKVKERFVLFDLPADLETRAYNHWIARGRVGPSWEANKAHYIHNYVRHKCSNWDRLRHLERLTLECADIPTGGPFDRRYRYKALRKHVDAEIDKALERLSYKS
jgi:hypothetical protein